MSSFTQEFNQKPKKGSKVSLNYIFGNQKYLNVDYIYRIKSIQFQYAKSLKKSSNFKLEVLGYVQYGKSEYFFSILSCIFEKGTEIGMNGGFKLGISIFDDRLNQYISLSTGPHYISEAPARQSIGFNMATNLFAITEFQFINNLYLNFQIGIRHLSNADIKKPNGGINNLLLGVGLSMQI
jgi:hypothetical protein